MNEEKRARRARNAAFERVCEVNGWRLANCSLCGSAVTSSEEARRHKVFSNVHWLAGKIEGRPACGSCLDAKARELEKAKESA